MTRRARWLGTATAFVVAATCLAPSNRGQAAEGTRHAVKGTVVGADGTPVAGRTLWLVRQNYSYPMQGESVVEIRTQSDSQGRFTLEFDRALFAAGEDLRLVTTKDRRWLPLLDELGFLSLLKLDPAAETTQAGTLRLKPE